MIGLKNKADLPVAQPRQRARGQGAQIRPVKYNFPRVGQVQPAQQVQQRAFPRPGRAAQRQELAALHRQLHVPQHLQPAPAHQIGLAHPARRKDRSPAVSGAPACAGAARSLMAQRLHRFQAAGPPGGKQPRQNAAHKAVPQISKMSPRLNQAGSS